MIDFQLTKRRLREYGQGRAKAASSLVRSTGVCPGGAAVLPIIMRDFHDMQL
jgi:hypothetical protein